MATADRLAKVFIVEDNPDDIFLMNMIMRRQRVSIEFSYFRDGEEFVNYMVNKAKALDGERPDLVLLDLNLPRIDGCDVLKFIKQDEELQTIPVVMLSGSSSPSDMEKVRRLGASAYLIKPLDLESLKAVTHHVPNLSLVEESSARYFVKRAC